MKFIIKSIKIWLLLLVASLPFVAKADQHAIFVDVGSSASRLHIFQYDKTNVFLTIKNVFSVDSDLGLSYYMKYPKASRIELSKLFNAASEFLQEKQVNLQTVSVNMLGTAGMRSLPLSDQRAIYTEVTNYIKKNYSFSKVNAQTISGAMEGVYGWLTVNYLLGNFQQQKPTVGSIDVGGVSMEIAYAVSNYTQVNDTIKVTINNQSYYVFSKSFLGLGLDAVKKSIINSKLVDVCYPRQYVFMDNRVGAFNFNKCAEVYNHFIQGNGIKEQLQPISGQVFVAHSGIYSVYNFFKVDKTLNQDIVLTRVNAVCNRSWGELKQIYHKVDEKYLSARCANAVYLSQLLYNTCWLNGSRLIITNEINKQKLNWSLGAALYLLTQPN